MSHDANQEWPYGWTPRDRHALYEARWGGGIYFVGAIVLVGIAVALFISASDPGTVLIAVGLLVVGFFEGIWAIRYSTNCFRWAGIEPWWLRVGWLAAITWAGERTGSTAARIDRFGRRWSGLLTVASLVVGIVALVLAIR